MKTIKAKYYLIPAIICLVVIGGLVYYYFLTDVAKEDKVSYLYIDDDDTADSVYIKLEPMATSHGLTGLKYLATLNIDTEDLRDSDAVSKEKLT